MFEVFENPWGLLVLAGVSVIAVWVFGVVVGDRKRWWYWLFPLVIGGIGFLVDASVKTDLEKIRSVIAVVVKAAEEEDCDVIEGKISEKYRDSYHRSKKYLMSDLRSRLSGPLIEKNIKNISSVEIGESKMEATAEFTVRIIFDPRGSVYQYMQKMLIKVNAELVKSEDGSWFIGRAELSSVNLQAAKWKDLGQVRNF